MKTKIHAIAGSIAFLTILSFWTSTLFSELFASHATIAMIKGLILQGMFILIPAMIIVGSTGMALGGKREDALPVAKKKRMPIIALTGLLVLLPAAFYLESKAVAGSFDLWFYVIQAVELIAGASNLRLIGLNIRDGLQLTGRLKVRGKNGAEDTDALPLIKVQKNGPLFVENVAEINHAGDSKLEPKQTTVLCRCGASKNKPYCDGSHNQIEFNDQPCDDHTADKVRVYSGQNIDIHYNKLLCSHAKICGRALESVFDSAKTPWISPDEGSIEEIINIIKQCPSGALNYADPGKQAKIKAVSECKIDIEPNGPYFVQGVTLSDVSAPSGANPDKYALCRCGASKNKPYCDGNHVNINCQS